MCLERKVTQTLKDYFVSGGPSNRVLEGEIQNIIDCGLRLIPDPVDEPEAATILDELAIDGLS